ncbi:uncharacterized protein LOC117651954 [Thrips palmi]|uniref:Uncharacterized protein LOC117651954 n=1 Tax=Thrips palmi TaxID=161013 RepID=A0A6P9A3N5_THRPL|nr:uncharacterized protein LOC117651954 [Thrips palmi]
MVSVVSKRSGWRISRLPYLALTPCTSQTTGVGATCSSRADARLFSPIWRAAVSVCCRPWFCLTSRCRGASASRASSAEVKHRDATQFCALRDILGDRLPARGGFFKLRLPRPRMLIGTFCCQSAATLEFGEAMARPCPT